MCRLSASALITTTVAMHVDTEAMYTACKMHHILVISPIHCDDVKIKSLCII